MDALHDNDGAYMHHTRHYTTANSTGQRARRVKPEHIKRNTRLRSKSVATEDINYSDNLRRHLSSQSATGPRISYIAIGVFVFQAFVVVLSYSSHEALVLADTARGHCNAPSWTWELAFTL